MLAGLLHFERACAPPLLRAYLVGGPTAMPVWLAVSERPDITIDDALSKMSEVAAGSS
jgi:hypothetical protein